MPHADIQKGIVKSACEGIKITLPFTSGKEPIVKNNSIKLKHISTRTPDKQYAILFIYYTPNSHCFSSIAYNKWKIKLTKVRFSEHRKGAKDMFSLFLGEIKNNTKEDYVKYFEGLQVLCCSSLIDNCWSICGGADEENSKKYKEILFETVGKDEGITDMKEFEEAMECGEFGIEVKKENIINIKRMCKYDLEKMEIVSESEGEDEQRASKGND